MAERRHKGDVGILRIDGDSSDLARVGQAGVLPCPAGIDRLVDTVAVREVAADIGLAHTDVNDVRIRRRNRNRTDRPGFHVPVCHRIPRDAGIVCFPDPATGGTHVVDQRLTRDAGNGRDPAAAIGPDAPPAKGLEEGRVVDVWCRLRMNNGEGKKKRYDDKADSTLRNADCGLRIRLSI